MRTNQIYQELALCMYHQDEGVFYNFTIGMNILNMVGEWLFNYLISEYVDELFEDGIIKEKEFA